MSPIHYNFDAQAMAASLIQNSYWVADKIFPNEFAPKLYELALQHHHQGRLKAAAIGHKGLKQRMESIRGDYIEWIENWDESPELSAYRQFLETLGRHLSSQLFIALKRFEVHFSIYPEGTFYKKHLDQHRDSKHRQVSCLYYLSPWTESYGGELKIYPKDKEAFEIQPLQGRFVCFLSGELPHEVLTTRALRCALTGWFRDDAEDIF